MKPKEELLEYEKKMKGALDIVAKIVWTLLLLILGFYVLMSLLLPFNLVLLPPDSIHTLILRANTLLMGFVIIYLVIFIIGNGLKTREVLFKKVPGLLKGLFRIWALLFIVIIGNLIVSTILIFKFSSSSQATLASLFKLEQWLDFGIMLMAATIKEFNCRYFEKRK